MSKLQSNQTYFNLLWWVEVPSNVRKNLQEKFGQEFLFIMNIIDTSVISN